MVGTIQKIGAHPGDKPLAAVAYSLNTPWVCPTESSVITMIKNKLESINNNPWNFRKTFVIEWYNRNEGADGWASAPASSNDLNGNTNDHEDLGTLLALQRHYGVAEMDPIHLSPMTARWAEASSVGPQLCGWEYGHAFGLAWRVRVR